MFPPTTGPRTVIVLSPHRDDAAFSCGLLLARLLNAGAFVHVINVCTVSDYAPYLPCTTEPRVPQVTAARLAEDRHFLERLQAVAGENGARCTMTDLGWRDGPLRLGIPTEEVLEVPQLPEEVHALAEVLSRWREADAVLAPVGLGNHVDHRLVRDAARVAFDAQQLGFYEDLPYACWMSAEQRMQTAKELVSGNLHAATELWRASNDDSTLLPLAQQKRLFALCYPSQIAEDVADAMAADSMLRHGGERMHLSAGAAHVVQSALSAPLP